MLWVSKDLRNFDVGVGGLWCCFKVDVLYAFINYNGEILGAPSMVHIHSITPSIHLVSRPIHLIPFTWGLESIEIHHASRKRDEVLNPQHDNK